MFSARLAFSSIVRSPILFLRADKFSWYFCSDNLSFRESDEKLTISSFNCVIDRFSSVDFFFDNFFVLLCFRNDSDCYVTFNFEYCYCFLFTDDLRS